VDLLRQLHSRDTRRPFCPKDHWLAQEVTLPASEIGSHRLNLRKSYRPFKRLRLFGPIKLGNISEYFHFSGEKKSFRVSIVEEGPPLSTKEVRNMAVLQEMHFVVAFEQRVLLFQTLVLQEKQEHQADAAFLQGPTIQIMVRRNYLYEDAFEKLSPENGKVYSFINTAVADI
jgi:ubiquitin-protein ligase E3 C